MVLFFIREIEFKPFLQDHAHSNVQALKIEYYVQQHQMIFESL